MGIPVNQPQMKKGGGGKPNQILNMVENILPNICNRPRLISIPPSKAVT